MTSIIMLPTPVPQPRGPRPATEAAGTTAGSSPTGADDFARTLEAAGTGSPDGDRPTTQDAAARPQADADGDPAATGTTGATEQRGSGHGFVTVADLVRAASSLLAGVGGTAEARSTLETAAADGMLGGAVGEDVEDEADATGEAAGPDGAAPALTAEGDLAAVVDLAAWRSGTRAGHAAPAGDPASAPASGTAGAPTTPALTGPGAATGSAGSAGTAAPVIPTAPVDALATATDGAEALTPGTPSAPAVTPTAGPAAPAAAPSGETGQVAPVAAPQPAAATTPSAPVERPAALPGEVRPLAEQLGVRLSTALRTAAPGEHVMTLRVDPEAFGPVRVVARIGAEGVRIELLGATDQAREALRTALPDLRRDLVAAGLSGSLDLGTSGGQRQAGAETGNGTGTDGRSAQRSAPGAPGTSSAPDDTATSTPDAARAAVGRLDLLV